MKTPHNKINFHAVNGCAHLTGFNYQPSWGYNGLTVWGDTFDARKCRGELARGKELFSGFNVVRIWLSWSAYKENPERFVKHAKQAVDICGELDLLVIPVLFTRWIGDPPFDPIHDSDFLNVDLSEQFGPYIDATVRPHSRDKRILAWDLCNEPEVHKPLPRWLALDPAVFVAFKRFHVSQPAGRAQFQWLTFIHDRIKQIDSDALTCVGTLADYGLGEIFEPMSDILTPHLYGYPPWELKRKQQPELKFKGFFEKMVSDYMAWAERVKKPVISSETCWGSLNDKDRVEIIKMTLEVLSGHGIGFLVHALYTSGVADLHPPELGPISGAGYMAFIQPDGSLRPGHDVYNDYCKPRQ